MRYETIKEYSEARFKQVTGVRFATFDAMLEVVKASYVEMHSKHNGRHRKLSCENMLLMTLSYYKEYRTLDCIGATYDLTKSSAGKTIRWVESVLVKSGKFSLPGKKKLSQATVEYEVIVVDTTETPIQRPATGQKSYYSGKKNDTP